MANTLMTLLVRLGIDSAEFQSGLKGAEKSAIGSAKKMSDAFGKVGDALMVGVTLPLTAAGAAALKSASDYQETANKAKVVFGEMAKDIEKSASSAAKTMGMSKREYLDYASSLAAAFKAGGMGMKESTKLAQEAVKHFADLTSFHNANVEDVAASWQSAIRGQYEPIQKYFPFITDAYLKTYGIANKLVDANTKTLTANQRAVIINAIAFNEQLNPALNDFAETADGFANKTRSFVKQVEDLKTALGENLLPMALDTVNALNELLDKFQALSPETQKAIVNFGIFLVVLGPILKFLQLLAGAFTFFSAGGAGAGIVTFFARLVPVLKASASAFGLNVFAVGMLKELFVGAAVVFGGSIAVMIAGIVALGVAIAALILEIKYFGPKALETLKMLWQIGKIVGGRLIDGLISGIKERLSYALQTIGFIVKIIYKKFRDAFGISSPSKLTEYLGDMLMQGLAKGITDNANKPMQAWADFATRQKEIFSQMRANTRGWLDYQRTASAAYARDITKLTTYYTGFAKQISALNTQFRAQINYGSSAFRQNLGMGQIPLTNPYGQSAVSVPQASMPTNQTGANTYNITVNGAGMTTAQVRGALIDALGAARR